MEPQDGTKGDLDPGFYLHGRLLPFGRSITSFTSRSIALEVFSLLLLPLSLFVALFTLNLHRLLSITSNHYRTKETSNSALAVVAIYR